MGCGFGFWQTRGEDGCRGSAVRVPALVGLLGVVDEEIGIEVFLHLVEAFIKFDPPHDAEVLVQKGAVQALDVAVGLRAADLSGAVLDIFQLQEQFIRVAVRAATVFPAVVGEYGVDAGIVGLEGGQHIVVHDMCGGHRQL